MHRKKIFHEISWCWVPTIYVKNILPYLVTYNWPKCAEIHVIILSSQRKRRIKDISFFDQGYAVRHTQNTHGFSSSHVWMWELDYKESFIFERQIIDAFELWCWRRLFRVPWAARRSNQSILKEISPGCSLQGLMLKLKLQSFAHLMQRDDSFEKSLMLGKIEGGRRRGRQRMRWLDGITDLMDVHTRECSLPGSSGHGILQARIREWVAMPCSRGWSWPREWTSVSYTAGRLPRSHQGSPTGELAPNKFKRDLISPPWHLVQ